MPRFVHLCRIIVCAFVQNRSTVLNDLLFWVPCNGTRCKMYAGAGPTLIHWLQCMPLQLSEFIYQLIYTSVVGCPVRPRSKHFGATLVPCWDSFKLSVRWLVSTTAEIRWRGLYYLECNVLPFCSWYLNETVSEWCSFVPLHSADTSPPCWVPGCSPSSSTRVIQGHALKVLLLLEVSMWDILKHLSHMNCVSSLSMVFSVWTLPQSRSRQSGFWQLCISTASSQRYLLT